MTLRRSWLRRASWAALVVVLLVQGLSWLLRSGWLHAPLQQRLAAAFGRPVEVQDFSVSLLGGPRLEANHVTVREDPAFGNEYFLRARQLTAGIRWTALFAGRLEFDTLSLKRPSLNLVRNPDGRWNLESWLPPAATAPSGARKTIPRFSKLTIEDGRINFKRGIEKLPFAFKTVSGSVSDEGGGRWRLDLKAELFRATVVLQQPGVLRLRGVISGTSARLRPAQLSLQWREASLADALRFAAGYDFGVRGAIEADIRAETTGSSSGWELSAQARIFSVHRWDLPPGPSDPSLNFSAQALWLPAASRIEFSSARFDAPQSNLSGSGWLQWAAPADSHFRFDSEGISLNDLLSWLRAFRSGVEGAAVLEGAVIARLSLQGWPPRVVNGELTTTGARLRAPSLPQPLGLGAASLRFAPGRITLQPATISLPRQGARLRAEGAVRQQRHGWQFDVCLSGDVARTEHLLPAADALGWGLAGWWNRTFQPAGAVRVNLCWEGPLRSLSGIPSGNIHLLGIKLHPAIVSQPVTIQRGRLEWHPAQEVVRVSIAAADAFGTRWSGTLERIRNSPQWSFSLSAAKVDVAELDRWLGPRAQRGLLARVWLAIAGESKPSDAANWLSQLRASGELRAAEVMLAPFRLADFAAKVEVGRQPRRVQIREARAQFYGGTLRGDFDAEFDRQPVYRATAEFADVDLRRLASVSPVLRGMFAGSASGTISLEAHGIGREELLRSLEADGEAVVRNALVSKLDLRQSFRAGAPAAGSTWFARAEGNFRVGERRVRLEDFRAAGSGWEYAIQGSVDFLRVANLRVELLNGAMLARAGSAGAGDGASARKVLQLSGPLEDLRVSLLEPQPRPRRQ
jgi:AsmA protein